MTMVTATTSNQQLKFSALNTWGYACMKNKTKFVTGEKTLGKLFDSYIKIILTGLCIFKNTSVKHDRNLTFYISFIVRHETL